MSLQKEKRKAAGIDSLSLTKKAQAPTPVLSRVCDGHATASVGTSRILTAFKKVVQYTYLTNTGKY